MTKRRSTKSALISSVLALLLCFTMLLGTTFAWFTDSVTSMNNIIKSGNLAIGLEYYDGDSWEEVTENTNVFENSLWEPGHTEVVYLKVSNLGTLALKYQLGINIVNEIESINVNGKALRLSDYIEFVAIDDVETPYADRAAARKAAAEAAAEGETAPAILSTGYTKSGNIEVGADAQYVALVVYMPETVGNEANYRVGEVAPEITLGINLMATQYTYEEDSFDEKYDENALYNIVPSARVTKLAEMPTVTTINGNTVTLDAGYVFNTTETDEEAKMNAHRYWHADFVASLDKTVMASDLGLWGQYGNYDLAFELDTQDDFEITADTPIRMLELVGGYMNYEELCRDVQKFSCGAFAVDQAAMEGVTMTVELRLYETTVDPNVGTGDKNVEVVPENYEVIGTYSYTFGAKKVSTSAELKATLEKGGDVVLAADINLTEGVTVSADADVTLDLNGKNITMKSETAVSMITNKGSLTINGPGKIAYTFNGTPSTDVAANTIENRGVLFVNGAEISNTGNGNQIGYGIDTRNGSTLTVEGGKITATGSSYYDGIRLMCGSNDTTVTVDGCEISSIWAQNPSADKLREVKGTVVINGGTVNTTYYENYTTVQVKNGVTATVTPYGAGSNNTTSAVVDGYTVYSFVH